MTNAIKNQIGLVISKIQGFFNNKKMQKIIFISYLVLLPLLCLVRDVFHVGISKYIFVAICLLFSIVLNNDYFSYFFVYTVPFAIGLPDLFIFAILSGMIIVRFFKKFSIKSWILIISVPLFFLLLEVVLTYAYGSLNIKDSLRLFAVLFFLSFCFYNRDIFTYKHVLMLLFGYVVSYFLIAFQVIEVGLWGIKHRDYYWVNFKYLLNAYRFGSKESAALWVDTGCSINYPYISDMFLKENPNNVALSALLGGASAYFIYPIINDKKDKITCIVLGILITLFGFWTLSRTFILIEILFGVLLAILSIIQRRSKTIDALIALILVILIISLFLLINKTFFQSILNRFFDYDVSSGGNRLTLIGLYFSKMFTSFKYVFFGVGATNIVNEYGIDAPPHTNFVQLCCGYGLPVTILFIGFVIFCFIKFQKRIKITNYRFGFYIPMILGILFTLADQIFFPTSILIIFLFTVILASFNNKESKISIPESFHYADVFDNFSSKSCYSFGKVSFVDEKRKKIQINLGALLTKEQTSKILKEIIEQKPAYIVVNYKDICGNKKLCKLLSKFKSSLVLIVCEEDVAVSFKERFKKLFFWDTFGFVYKHEITAEKFEGKKFVNKHLIYGESKLNVENVFAYLKSTKGRK